MNPRLKMRVAQLPSATEKPPSGPSSTTITLLPQYSEHSIQDDANLLLSVSEIVNREVQKSGLHGLWLDETMDHNQSAWNPLSAAATTTAVKLPKFPRLSLYPSSSSDDSDDFDHLHRNNSKNDDIISCLKPRPELSSFPKGGNGRVKLIPKTSSFTASGGHRRRTVSIDSPRLVGSRGSRATTVTSPISLTTSSMSTNKKLAIVSPVAPLGKATTSYMSAQASPRTRRLPLRHKNKASTGAAPVTPRGEAKPLVNAAVVHSPVKGKALQETPPKGRPITTIYRKKFSWKNYPELEAFLVANREEYLRHSALNYTVQQKQYNNRLTEQLLELATEHGYLFDISEFSFVTVRDRIRCYFKSYVQSAKKRGVLMGYAARKAGLLTEDDLAGVDGHIVTPS